MRTNPITSNNSTENLIADDITAEDPNKIGKFQCYMYERSVRRGNESERIFLLQNFGDGEPAQPKSLKRRVSFCSRKCTALAVIIISCFFYCLYSYSSAESSSRY